MISYRKTLLWENISPGRCYKLPRSLPSRSAVIDRCCGRHVGALLAPLKKIEPLYQCVYPNAAAKLGLAWGCNSNPHQACCQGRESSDCTLQLPALTLSLKPIGSSDLLLQIILSGVQQNIPFIHCPSTYAL